MIQVLDVLKVNKRFDINLCNAEFPHFAKYTGQGKNLSAKCYENNDNDTMSMDVGTQHWQSNDYPTSTLVWVLQLQEIKSQK